MKILKSILLIYIISGNFLLAQFFLGGGGNGTKSYPFQIYTKAHLEELRDAVLLSPNNTPEANWSKGKYFILMNDITDSMRTVIGGFSSYYPNECFQGNFDGQGHKITLALNPNRAQDVHNSTINGYIACALFAFVSDTVVIKNLIVDGYIKGTTSYAAGIVGEGIGINSSYITIKNCINMANISIINDSYKSIIFVGGIGGGFSNKLLVEDCLNIGNIEIESTSMTAITMSAGIIAFCIENISTFNRCINAGYIKGNIAGGRNIAGGINTCINADKVNVTNCINIGIVEGDAGKTGAIEGSEY